MPRSPAEVRGGVFHVMQHPTMARFFDKAPRAFHQTGKCPAEWKAFERVAARKLDMVLNAARLDDFRIPPINKFEKLERDREGQYSIRINDQYRVCFTWDGTKAMRIEITDYH